MKDEESGTTKGQLLSESNGDIMIENISFRYAGPTSPEVLRDISMRIPEGKITAIVGVSGSGKTTLIKLLLRFYDPLEGDIHVGATDLATLQHKTWRKLCSGVLQDGYIFNDTIAGNIALGEEVVDIERLIYAAKVANIYDYVKSQPYGFDRPIGGEGQGLSGGEKQRILIARAVYADPQYLFFDEATNSLDANNEREIMMNLNKFFISKTVIIVAHRLSTVMNADQIVVLDKGKIVERGNHQELTKLRGHYFQLVKNQLELGQD